MVIQSAIDILPLVVASGGTGAGSFTAKGIVFGSGTSALGVTAGLTNGQLVIGSTAGNPAAGTITSTGSTITISLGANTINIEAASAIAASFVTNSGTATPSANSLNVLGSTGTGISTSGSGSTVTIAGLAASTSQVGTVALASSATTITGTDTTQATTSAGVTAKLGSLSSNGIAIGAGASNAMSYQFLNDGQILIGGTALNPLPGTLTAGSNIIVTNAPHSITVAVTGSPSFSAISLGTPLSAVYGGTGAASLTSNAILVGNGTGIISDIGAMTNGQIPIGRTSSSPLAATITQGGNLTVTNGSGSITISDSATPTFTSLSLTNALTVPNGGTGAQTLTSNGVLIGAGTSAVSGITAGSTGQLLVGVTSSAPAFGNSVSADTTFTSATSGATRTLTVSNTSNTSSSQATTLHSVAGTTAGDAWTQYTVGTTRSYAVGVKNSATQAFVLTTAASGTVNPSSASIIMQATGSGQVTLPLQPAFYAVAASSQSNATGNGTVATVVFGTELYDVGSNFATNTFTAPGTAKYLLGANVTLTGMLSTHTNMQFLIVTSARSYYGMVGSPFAMENSGSALTISCCFQADMTAADTATVTMTVFNGTKVVSFFGDGTVQTSFWGRLVG